MSLGRILRRGFGSHAAIRGWAASRHEAIGTPAEALDLDRVERHNGRSIRGVGARLTRPRPREFPWAGTTVRFAAERLLRRAPPGADASSGRY